MQSTETPKVHYLSITKDYDQQRIDNFLLRYLKGVPKTHIYRLLRKGEVRINKKRCRPDYRLQTDDNLRIPPVRVSKKELPPAPSQSLITQVKQRILYEDDDLMIFNKPAGMAAHSGSGVAYGVIETLRNIYSELKYLALAHRLDRATSGCIMLAKNGSTLKKLHEQLRNSEIKKTYIALVKGHWPEKLNQINAPLLRSQLRSGERMVIVNQEGKASITYFKPLQYFAQATLIEASPDTGRTHQIRVHAAHAGYPIAGDTKYGDKKFNQTIQKKGCKRLFLHAQALKFKHHDKELIVTAELELDLKSLLEQL